MSARTVRTHLLFVAVVAAFIALAVLLAPGTAGAMALGAGDGSPAPASTAGTIPGGAGDYVDQFVAAVTGNGTDVTPAQSAVIYEARTVVCQGFADDVPSDRITRTLLEAYGFTTPEAHAVMAAVIGYGC